jgi:hypothetical protein
MCWQCTYVDSKGRRCEAEALHRLHFSNDHPFDHVDVCDGHLKDYSNYTKKENIDEIPRYETLSTL